MSLSCNCYRSNSLTFTFLSPSESVFFFWKVVEQVSSSCETKFFLTADPLINNPNFQRPCSYVLKDNFSHVKHAEQKYYGRNMWKVFSCYSLCIVKYILLWITTHYSWWLLYLLVFSLGSQTLLLSPYVDCFCRSLVFHDFIAKCLTKEPRLRPTATEMLKVCWIYFQHLPSFSFPLLFS